MSLYASITDVRNLTGLSSTEISDAIISGMIAHASAQLNADIQYKHENERVGYINSEKENDVDGSNKKFYTRNFPIGDKDNNGIINGSDIYCYTLNSSTGERREIIVSGITTEGTEKASALGGPLWLSGVAPSSTETVFLTYYSSPVDMETPDKLVNLACTQLASALAYTRVDVTKVQSFRVGKIAVTKQSQAYDIFRRQYYDTINRIRQEIFKAIEAPETL